MVLFDLLAQRYDVVAELSPKERRALTVGARQRSDGQIEVVVRDSGPGFPVGQLSSSFDPFVTTKAGGSGLGLALVAKIVGDHGGIVEYDGTGPGGKFMIRLPVFNFTKMEAE